MGLPSSEIRVPARPPAVTTSWRGVRSRSDRALRRDIGRLARSPDAANRSERTMRNAATTNNQSRSRKPALVSCSTSSGTLGSSLLGRVVVNVIHLCHHLLGWVITPERSILGDQY